MLVLHGLQLTVAGQKKKGDSKLLSLDKEPKEDERKEERKATQPCLLVGNVGGRVYHLNFNFPGFCLVSNTLTISTKSLFSL